MAESGQYNIILQRLINGELKTFFRARLTASLELGNEYRLWLPNPLIPNEGMFGRAVVTPAVTQDILLGIVPQFKRDFSSRNIGFECEIVPSTLQPGLFIGGKFNTLFTQANIIVPSLEVQGTLIRTGYTVENSAEVKGMIHGIIGVFVAELWDEG